MNGAIRTRIINVESKTPEILVEGINELQEQFNVFATQTHFAPDQQLPWVAFVFYREPLGEAND